jgi:hypothetical protein
VKQAIAELQPTSTTGELGDALELASKLARRSGDAQILIATDAALATTPTLEVEAPITVLPVGRDRKNQAIVALAVRTDPSALTQSAFIGVANLDLEATRRRVEVYGDGILIEARDIDLDPQARQDIIVDDITDGRQRTIGVLEVRLTTPTGTVVQGAPDQLAIDDRAWAIVPAARVREVLLVSEGDPYLETALTKLPNVNPFLVDPDRYPADAVRDDGTAWDLIIFEGFVPRTLPDVPILAIAPDRSSALGELDGTLTNPGIGTIDPREPILNFVDLTTTHIAEAARLTLPDWARAVIPGPRGSPLLYAGERDGIRTAVLAFDPRQSDLPLQVGFPILLANLTGELLGGSATPVDAVSPGDPVELTLRPGVAALRVTRPDGTVQELVAGSDSSSAVTFSATDLPGVYTVIPILAPATPAPSGATPQPTPTPDPSAGPAVDPTQPSSFVVALFDVRESTIAPGNPAELVALGSEPGTGPGVSPGTGGTVTERPTTRDELWIPIILIVLVGLCIEWAVYHRDALARIRRGMSTRFGRATGGST